MKQNPKDPIAIVGIGCRFPGGSSSPKSFWNLLKRGKDAIVDVPRDRWDIRRFYDENPDKPGKTYVKQGGFLKEKIDHFDPLFFGISPREAESMDPQQRLLLEVTWEAFENAGITENEMRGSRTGVFVGGFCLDNLLMRLGQLNRELANSHSAVSSTMTMLSNRISYVFDLKGPSLTMDTACSSSLVATHFACQSLWNEESDMALVGGVNVMMRPEFPIIMSKGKFLSPHGRCKAFDEDAAGYTRGEGAGVLLLKPLSKAQENKDRIFGLIKETGVNQDGHTAGISLPNSKAQEQLVREVYKNAGVSPSDIQYIEAHGTGTQAGDPAEIQALHNVLSENRDPSNKCFVGSVKTNIGHLEAGAGVAGLIKAVLSLHNEQIAPNLHFKKANPRIPFDELCIQVSTKLQDWKRNEKIRYAGVNSFGYGGTNAHVLLQEAPSPLQVKADQKEVGESDRPILLPVSARDENALKELAGKYAFSLAGNSSPSNIANICYTATQRRTHHSHRLAITANNFDDLKLKLQQYSAGEIVEQVTANIADLNREPRLVFIYTGMGPQWWAMGRELMEKEAVFREAIDEFDTLFREETGWSILHELKTEESHSRMAETAIAQPANFAIQVGLTALWKSWGIVPDAVIGHSVGEVASAYASGALSLRDAIKVSHHRSRLQQTLAGQGAMLAAGLSEKEALELIDSYDHISIGAINGPNSVTLSGDPNQLKEVAETIEQRGIFNRMLGVEVAYHSPQMEAIRDDILSSLASIRPQKTQTTLYSTVTGSQIHGKKLTADYWWQNIREPVRFRKAIQTLFDNDYENFLEVGPHPVLGHSVKEISASAKVSVQLTPSLNRKLPEHIRMLESLGQLYTQGFNINWRPISPKEGKAIDLPNYPWQKELYWVESSESRQDRLGLNGSVFLNQRLASPRPTWTVEINKQFFPFLRDHKVNGQIVFPGAAYIEAGLAISNQLHEADVHTLMDLKLHQMLQIDERQTQTLSVSFDEESSKFYVHSQSGGKDANWELHASGRRINSDFECTKKSVDLTELRASFVDERTIEKMYSVLKSRGLDYGERFRLAKRVWLKKNEILVRIENDESAQNSYLMSPEILDTTFHSILSLIEGTQPFVPQSIEKLTLSKSNNSAGWFHGVITQRDESSFRANINLIDDTGNIFLEIKNAHMRALPNALENNANTLDQLLYNQEWKEFALKPDETPLRDDQLLLFVSDKKLDLELEEKLRNEKAGYTTITKGSTAFLNSSNHIQINENIAENYERIFNTFKSEKNIRILYFWPLENNSEELDFESMVSQCRNIVYLVQAIQKHSISKCSLSIFTRGAQTLNKLETQSGLNSSVLWGLGQLIENECAEITCRTIDLDPNEPIYKTPLWFENMLSTPFKEIAFRDRKTYSLALQRFKFEESINEEVTELLPTNLPLILDQPRRGRIGSLKYRRTSRIEPSSEEIEIKTHSVGLNFRDAYNLNGSHSAYDTSHSYLGNAIGVEIAGTVTRLGTNVKNLSVGDRVSGLTCNGIQSFALVKPQFISKIPDKIATDDYFIYIDFLTAYYGLIEIAKLKQGERILIHPATDDLGLSAIQIAKWIGAEIFATANTNEKRDYLCSLGIEHVMNSRSFEFVEEIEKVTYGKGVQVVLNTLPGETRLQSISTLSHNGRFIDVGKKEESKEAVMQSAVFKKNVLFASIDIDSVLAQRPDLVVSMIDKIKSGFANGELSPILLHRFPANEISKAFQSVLKSDKVGKIIVNFDGVSVEAAPEIDCEATARETGTIIITGGNSGFGIEVAKWFAKKSIYKIVLASRSGAKSDIAQASIEEMRLGGSNVVSHAIDITDYNATRALISEIEKSGPPLVGILHGAMVLEDSFIKDLNEAKLHNVMAPKVLGAITLYECTKDLDLQFFISFSSISSLIGNRGQANYIAANSFLDAFSQRLRARGFPVTTINWGALSESGILARNETVGKLLANDGINGITNAQALSALDRILVSDLGQIGVFDVDWSTWSESNPKIATSPRFAALVNRDKGSGKHGKAITLLNTMAELESDQHIDFLAEMATKGLSRVLKIPSTKIDSSMTLDKLGVDSLMLIELALTIQSEFGINIPAGELSKYPTIKSLATNLQERLSIIKNDLTN